MSIPASTLLHLQDLHRQPVGTKVRFLGCIRAYNLADATLILTFPPKPIPRASVNISVPLPTLNIGTLKDGFWVNVIGYVTEAKNDDDPGEGITSVNAIALWPAGNVTPSKYKEVLEGRLSVERELDRQQSCIRPEFQSNMHETPEQ
ncbi:telomere capping, CST complex subunit-domain-containing protein [Sphaerosporella brunnea]|uniref:Telomere capping, CST complex subunit-domain-containing protein n=1 Tax=Sphaerosporella brunnea TaxID=1250544 RepID=A0A5J5F8H0_9PEZI|nr:telomere capping, CST complex subunit-domain-containing protein [Sphaerosporella brunnea]